MNHKTLILVIRRLSECARKAEAAYSVASFNYSPESCRNVVIAGLCRAKIDQLTERYS